VAAIFCKEASVIYGLLFYTGSCEKAALLAALKESLPPFMQPNTAVQLDEMPLNKNGKIDRTALAALTKKGAHK
jgi:acyl-coenzyme A synthetase/AMP-(fatty) acid ligase